METIIKILIMYFSILISVYYYKWKYHIIIKKLQTINL